MTKSPLSVTEFLSIVKGIVSDVPLFQNVYLGGEVSNFKAHASGHFYFSLKDEQARISAVMFRSQAQSLLFKPKDGDKVIIQGRFDVYQQTGQIQIYVSKMNLDGLGDLYIQYEALKKELASRGYFDDALKKPFPTYPNRIGVITGKGSAAYADISRTLKSRWPLCEQVDLFSLVQGVDATQNIVEQLLYADGLALDAIILARGGGSIEDLWAFNTLPVIEAIHMCKTPIVTGIGHESDITLSDYVADHRAATPTGAAHDITPDITSVLKQCMNHELMFVTQINHRLSQQRKALDHIEEKPYYLNPSALLNYRWMDLDRINFALNQNYHQLHGQIQQVSKLVDSMQVMVNRRIEKQRFDCVQAQNQMNYLLSDILSAKSRDFLAHKQQLFKSISYAVTLKKTAFNGILKSLNYLSPLNVMIRGYSVSTHNEAVIKSIDDVCINDEIKTRLTDGFLISKIIGKDRNDD